MDTSNSNQPKSFLSEDSEVQEIFDIGASDKEITSTLRNRIDASEKWYDGDPRYKLKERRRRNNKLLWGDHYGATRYPTLYNHSLKYEENQVYVAVQTIVSYLVSRVPNCEARAWRDTNAGKLLAQDFEKFCEAHSIEHDLVSKLTRVFYDLMEKRVGVLKLVVDNKYKGIGDCIPMHVDPNNIVVDHESRKDDNPGFVAEKLNETLSTIIQRFPDKKAAILEHCNVKQGTMNQYATRHDYYEVWITGVGKDGAPEEQLVCFMGGLVLLKTRNPHWAYDVEEDVISNYLPYPPKPYLFTNLLNDGSNKIDQKTIIELVESIQHAINRRKRAIGEQAEQFAGLKVWSGDAVDKDDVEELSGEPGESIVVDAENVSNAVTKISPDYMPDYLYQDLLDMRDTLHLIAGTPPELRGDNSDAGTLGEAIMNRDQAEGRMTTLIRSVDSLMNKYYPMLLHFLKIYYTKEHWKSIAGEDGTYEYVMMKRDKLSDGLDVFVKGGSTLPFDRARASNTALELAKLQRISTIDLYNDLDLPNAQRRYDRWVKETVDPTLMAKEVSEEEGERTAQMDFELVKSGEPAPPREDPKPNHITTHRAQLVSDEFQDLPAEQQAVLQAHVQAEIESLARRASTEEGGLQAKIDAQNDPMLPGGALPPEQVPGAGQPPMPPAPGGEAPMPPPPQPAGGQTMPTPESPAPLPNSV